MNYHIILISWDKNNQSLSCWQLENHILYYTPQRWLPCYLRDERFSSQNLHCELPLAKIDGFTPTAWKVYIYRVIPVNVPYLFFNNFESSKDRTKLLNGKEREFFFKIRYQWFENPTIGHYTTPWLVKVSKCRKIMNILSENVHIITK